MFHRFCLPIVLLSVCFVALAGPANAMEEIIVTSLKHDMDWFETPAAVSVFDGEYLRDARINDLDTLQQHLPGLSVRQNRSPFDAALRLRGIGNEGNIPNFEPDVALYIDGALRVRTGLGMGDLLEVDRIEVMKGPQSTLYGKNATAGVVNIITPRPERKFSAWAEWTYGSFNQQRLRGSLNGPVGNSGAYRVSLLSDSRDGWMENTNGTGDPNEIGQQGVRAQYLFEPSQRFSVRIIAAAMKQDMLCCTPDISWSEEGLTAYAATSATPPGDTDGFNRRVSVSMPHHFDGDSRDFTAIIEYSSPFGKITSISSYDDYDYVIQSESSYTELDLARQKDRQQGDTVSEELRLNSAGDGPLSWLAGLYLFDSHFQRGARDDTPLFIAGDDWAVAGPGLASVAGDPLAALSYLNTVSGDRTFLSSRTDTESHSVFAQLSQRLGDSITAFAGARYLEEEKQFDLWQYSVDGNGLPIIAVLADANPANDTRVLSLFDTVLGAPGDFGNLAAERKTDAWTWNAGIHWAIDPRVSTYFTVSHGFKSGGFNGDWGKQTVGDPALGVAALLVPENPADREFDDETVDNLEIGFKSLLFDQRLRLSGALFNSDYDNLQSAAFTGTNFIVRNAGRVVVRGIEVEMEAVLSETVRGYLSAISLDSEYRDFAAPCGDRMLNESCTGYPLPMTPEREAHLGLQTLTALGSGAVYSRLDWSWSDDYSASADFYPGTQQQAYSTVNVNLGWRNERFDISLWGRNVTDETAQIVAGAQPLYNGILRYLNEPRVVGLTLRVGI